MITISILFKEQNIANNYFNDFKIVFTNNPSKFKF